MRPSLRFMILERDNFTCRYCGATPPDVRLEVDHVHPESQGGSDDPSNLVTSCSICNIGKRDRLTDGAPSRCPDCRDWILGGRCDGCRLDDVGCGITDDKHRLRREIQAKIDAGEGPTEYEMGLWDGLEMALVRYLATSLGATNMYGPPEERA
jgi:hypothetical protein